MEIKPGFGIDLLPFGYTERQVIDVLGQPDKSFFTDTDNKRLQFNSLLIELSFELDNDGRLGWIEVHNPSVKMWGKPLIGQSFKDVVSVVNQQLKEPAVIDDYGSFISAIYERNWMEFQFSFNRLTNINFGVLYNDEDEPLWPES